MHSKDKDRALYTASGMRGVPVRRKTMHAYLVRGVITNSAKAGVSVDRTAIDLPGLYLAVGELYG